MFKKLKQNFQSKSWFIHALSVLILLITIFLLVVSIYVLASGNIKNIGFFKFLGITHWQTVIMVWFVYISTLLLGWYQYKKDVHIIRKSFLLVLIGAIIYGLLTTYAISGISKKDDWTEESKSWLMLATNIFMEVMILIVPFYVFFTIIKTLTNSNENNLSSKSLITSFFSIWLMPFIAITIAFLIFPLIRLIPIFPEIKKWNTHKNPEDFIINLPQIFFLAIPKSLTIFYGMNRILGVVVISVIIGVLLTTAKKFNYHKANVVIQTISLPHKLISKLIYYVSLIIPIVIATRLTSLFNMVFLLQNLKIIAIFLAVFLLGWSVLFTSDLLIIFLTMKNRDKKNFFRFIKSYTLITYIKHAAAVHMNDTIRESKRLGVSDSVAEFTSGISTSMGASCCGGFYPAFITLVTISMMMNTGNISTHPSLGTIIGTILIIYIVVMTINLGMTGVPGSDSSIVLSVLAGLSLPTNVFYVVIALDTFIAPIRGIANGFGFVAANNIAERIINKKNKKNKLIKKNKKNIK